MSFRADVFSRRDFLLALPGAGLVVGFLPRRGGEAGVVEHPEPRPGVTAARVLRTDQLGEHGREAAPVFDMVRQIPHVVDGIHCYCGCANLPGFRSLLVCFEKDGMAQHCEICQGEARLAYRRHEEGQTLAQIRRAIDARYG